MTDAEVAALAARWRVPLFKTCVKDDVGVDELFAYLAKTHLALVAAGAVRPPEVTRYKLSDAAAAHRVSQSRHFRGKLVFVVR